MLPVPILARPPTTSRQSGRSSKACSVTSKMPRTSTSGNKRKQTAQPVGAAPAASKRASIRPRGATSTPAPGMLACALFFLACFVHCLPCSLALEMVRSQHFHHRLHHSCRLFFPRHGFRLPIALPPYLSCLAASRLPVSQLLCFPRGTFPPCSSPYCPRIIYSCSILADTSALASARGPRDESFEGCCHTARLSPFTLNPYPCARTSQVVFCILAMLLSPFNTHILSPPMLRFLCFRLASSLHAAHCAAWW